MFPASINEFFRFAFNQVKNKEVCDKEVIKTRCDPSLYKEGKDILKCVKCFKEKGLGLKEE